MKRFIIEENGFEANKYDLERMYDDRQLFVKHCVDSYSKSYVVGDFDNLEEAKSHLKTPIIQSHGNLYKVITYRIILTFEYDEDINQDEYNKDLNDLEEFDDTSKDWNEKTFFVSHDKFCKEYENL